VYLEDIKNDFDYYFSAVKPQETKEGQLVDYSIPALHQVVGFEPFPIFFPSFAEPMSTTREYLEFANLQAGHVAFDLGAYSGLTSILFALSGAHVVAVEPDPINLDAVYKNFQALKQYNGMEIALAEMAIWKDCKGVNFGSEGNMGSFVGDLVGALRGNAMQIPSTTLTALAEALKLERVDFIKCDIEGAEIEALDQPAFFAKYNPKLIIEAHTIKAELTTGRCTQILNKYGYVVAEMKQPGVGALPLLRCERKI
jgi:FkbM family methyltransferase